MNKDDVNNDDNDGGVSFLQGWSFSYLTCMTQHLFLILLLAQSLKVASTESCREDFWESVLPSPDISDVNTVFIKYTCSLSNWFLFNQ